MAAQARDQRVELMLRNLAPHRREQLEGVDDAPPGPDGGGDLAHRLLQLGADGDRFVEDEVVFGPPGAVLAASAWRSAASRATMCQLPRARQTRIIASASWRAR